MILVDLLLRTIAWFARAVLWLVGIALTLVVSIGAIVAIPVAVTEYSCRPGAEPAPPRPPAPIVEAEHRRPLVNTWLTYPEWYIVHAYEDFAATLARGDEHDFGYAGSIAGFWTSLCALKRVAGRHGGAPFDTNVMLYIIGFSFTGEMAIKGAWENSVGRAAIWWRGPAKTGEDLFAAATAADYAAFLRQMPWYAYPFFGKAGALWSRGRDGAPDFGRGWERRIALSLEYGGKGLYAIPIGWLAGIAPAELRIRSVVTGMEDAAASPGIAIVGAAPGGAVQVETPRYRAFTEFAMARAKRGADFVEIAGNRRVLVTLLAPVGIDPGIAAGRILFAFPVASRPGHDRLGVDLDVADLAGLIRRIEGSRLSLEHIYDY